MIYDVLLTKGSDNRYTARALALPDVIVSGANEDEALQHLRTAIEDLQANSRIVRVEVPAPADTPDDPWMRFAGMWADDPDWEIFQAEIESFREAIDAQTGYGHKERIERRSRRKSSHTAKISTRKRTQNSRALYPRH